MRVRGELGLRSDRAYVESLHSEDPNANIATNSDQAFPLTLQEESQLRFLSFDEAIPVITAYGEGDARSEYGGLYVSPREVDGTGLPGGKVVVVQFTSNLALHQRVLASIFPDPERIRVVQVSISLAELEAMSDRILNERTELAGMGIDVTTVGVRLKENKVVVGVRGDADIALGPLEEHYGPYFVTRSRNPRFIPTVVSRDSYWPQDP